MADYDNFVHGGVSYPLASPGSGVGQLLKDADPARWYAIDYFKSVLTTYLETRFLLEAAAIGLEASKIVYKTTSQDPQRWLTREWTGGFPLLAVYRISGVDKWKTQAWTEDIPKWGVDFVLPPCSADQAEVMEPILRAVGRVISSRIENCFDPAYQNGLEVWKAAGVEEIFLESEKYGTYFDAKGLLFPCWQGILVVKEIDRAPNALGVPLAGIDVGLDLAHRTAPTYVDLASQNLDFVNPTALPNLVGLFTADVGITAGSDPSKVGAWANQSGTIGSASPGGPSNQPTLVPNAFVVRGVPKPVIRFDGVQTYLQATAADLANDGGKTFVVLFRLSDPAKRSSILLQSQSGDLGAKTTGLEANTVSTAGARFGFFANNSSFDGVAPTDVGWHVAVIRETNTTNGGSVTSSLTLQIDNLNQPMTLKSGAGTWSSMVPANLLLMGGLPAALATTAGACDIGVVMAFNASLSDANAAKAVTFCKQWAGLS